MTFASRVLPFRFALIAMMLPLGCFGGKSEQYDVVPVSGTIFCEGKPVADATVNFTPLEAEGREGGRPGRVALGMTDDEGHFTLTTYENNDGAIVGKHTVTVGLNREESETTDPNRRFPCRNSTQEITVEPDMEEVMIDFSG